MREDEPWDPDFHLVLHRDEEGEIAQHVRRRGEEDDEPKVELGFWPMVLAPLDHHYFRHRGGCDASDRERGRRGEQEDVMFASQRLWGGRGDMLLSAPTSRGHDAQGGDWADRTLGPRCRPGAAATNPRSPLTGLGIEEFIQCLTPPNSPVRRLPPWIVQTARSEQAIGCCHEM